LLERVKEFFKIHLGNVIVINDDIDLPFGALRFKKGGGHGGHNGLKSLDSHISKEYLRVRVGVGKPEHKSQVVHYVLESFLEEERKQLEPLIAHIVQACKALVKQASINDIKSHYSLKSIASLQ